jgi:diacylglycerol kinase family enzyme
MDKPGADLSFLSAQAVSCFVPDVRSSQLRVQADGEMLGAMPAQISIIPKALTLLIPPETSSREVAVQSADPL